MNFEELRRLSELMKHLKGIQKQQELLRWLQEHRELLRQMSPQDLEEVREKAEYDEEAWQEILRQLS